MIKRILFTLLMSACSVLAASGYDDMKSFVREDNAVAIDDRLLLHILGDAFGKGTELEGSHGVYILPYQQEVLTQRVQLLSNDAALSSELTVLLNKFPTAIDLTRVFWMQRDATAFHTVFKNQIEQLPVEGSLFFAGGWTQHAIVIEAIRRTQDSYALRVYNLGQGLQYHQSYTVGSKRLSLPFFEVTNVSLDRLTHAYFAQALKELTTLKNDPNSEDQSFKKLDELFYTSILPFLQGNTTAGTYHENDLMLAQLSGTCSFTSLVAYYSQQFQDVATARHLSFEIQSKALHDYFLQHKGDLAKQTSSRNLAHKALTAYNVMTREAYKGQDISDDELRYAQELSSWCRTILDEADENVKDALDRKSAKAHTGRHEGYIEGRERDPVDIGDYDQPPREVKVPVEPVSFEQLNLDIHAHDLVAELERWAQQLHQANDLNQWKVVRYSIQDGAKALSLDITLPQEQRLPAARALLRVSREYVRAHIIGRMQRESNGVTAKEFLAQIKLQAVVESLVRAHDTELSESLPSLRPPKMRYFFNEWMHMVKTYDPEWDEQLGLLDQFWAKYRDTENKEDFFGLTLFPTDNRAAKARRTVVAPLDQAFYQRVDPVPWNLSHEWRDVAWTKDWLLKHRKELLQAPGYEEVAGESLEFQAMAALCEGGSYSPHVDILPEGFFLLRETAYLTDYSLISDPVYDQAPQMLDVDKGIQFYGISRKISDDQQTIWKWEANYHIFGQPHCSLGNTFCRTSDSAYKTGPEVRDPHTPLLEAQDLWCSVYNIEKREPFVPEDIPAKIFQSKWKYSDLHITELWDNENIGLVRRRMSLDSIASFQPVEVLGHYRTNIPLLNQCVHQEIFKRLIFSGPTLHLMLAKDPVRAAEFAKQASDFTAEQWNIHKHSGDTRMMLFYLDVTRLFNDYLSYYQRQNPTLFPEGFQLNFLNVRQEIREQLTNERLSADDRIRFRAELARTYLQDPTPLTDASVAELLASAIEAKALSKAVEESQDIKGLWADFQPPQTMLRDCQDILYMRRREVEACLSSQTGSKILGKMLKQIDPLASDVVWYRSDDEPTWQQPYALLRKWIYEGFNQLRLSYADTPDTHRWTRKSEFPNFLGQSDGFVYLNALEGTLWRQGTRPGEASPMPSIHDPVVIKHTPSLIEVIDRENDAHYFFDTTYSNDRPAKRTQGEHERYGLKDLEQPAWLEESHDAWYETDPQPQIVWVNRETNAVDYRALAPFAWISSSAKRIERLDAAGKPTGELLYESPTEMAVDFYDDDLTRLDNQIPSNTLRTYQRLDHNDHIALWMDRDDHPTSLEYKRLPLKFHVKEIHGTTRWVSDEFPDYRLADTQYLEQLGRISHYLLLQEIEGDKRLVIMSSIDLIELAPDESSLNPRIPLVFKTISGPFRLLTYGLDSDNTLRPHTTEARIYLANLLLWMHRYEDAARCLRGFGPALKPWNEYSTNVQMDAELVNLATANPTNKDSDPRAETVRLLAAYLYLRALHDFTTKIEDPQALEDFVKAITTRYWNYLQTTEWNKSDLLHPQEELELISLLNIQALPAVRVRMDELRAELGQQDISLEGHIPEGRSGQPIDGNWPTLTSKSRQQFPSALPLEEELATARGTLLLPELVRYFNLWYAAARRELSSDDLRLAIKGLTGTDVSNVPQAELMQYWRDGLMFAKGNGVKEEHVLPVAILLAVTDKPEQWPQCEQMQELLNDKKGIWEKESKELTELFELARQHYWQLNLKPQSDASSVTSRDQCPAVPTSLQSRPTYLCAAVEALPNGPLVSDIEAYLFQNPLTEEQLELLRNQAQELKGVFSFVPADTMIGGDQELIQYEIDAHATRAMAITYSYEITSPEKLNKLKDSLIERAEAMEQSIEEQTVLIHQLMQQQPKDTAKAHYLALAQSGDLDHHVSLTELVQLYATQNIDLLIQRCPNLNADQAIDLYQVVGAFIHRSIEKRRLDNAIASIQAVVKEQALSVDLIERQTELVKLYDALTGIHGYDVQQHPAYLAFEYFMPWLLRKAQIDVLDLLNIENGRIGSIQHLGAVVEMIMGSGKTSVLLPLLGQMIADGEHLALVVMPQALIPSMSESLQATLGESFGIQCEILQVERDIPNSDASKLEYILQKLQWAVQARRVVVMSDSALQSLYLNYLLALGQGADLLEGNIAIEEHTVTQKVRVFQQIFQFIQQHGIVVLDEVDVIMDVLRAHHFAVGQNKAVHPDVLTAVTGLYDLLLRREDLANIIRLPFLQSNEGEAFTTDIYQKQLAPAIVDAVLSGEFLPESPLFQKFLTNSEPSRSLLKAFLSDEDNPEAFAFVQAIPNTFVRNVLCTLHEELHKLLPLTGHRGLFVHYGPKQRKKQGFREPWAIPYHLGTPAVNSEFGTDLETLNYTLQMYLEMGITQQIAEWEVERLKSLLNNPRTQEQAAEGIQELLEGTDIQLTKIRESDYPAIINQVNGNSHLVLKLLTRHVLPLIRSYPLSLSSNAMIYQQLFQLVHGFSGTLWNLESFPEAFEIAYESDTRARTLQTLWKSTPRDTTVLSDPPAQSDALTFLIGEIYKSATTPLSVIDLAGFFRGIDGFKVAKAILDQSVPDVKGVIYYDPNGNIVVLEQGKDKPVSQKQITLKEGEQLVAFWDQAHTTGSDLKLHPNMKAAVTIGHHEVMRDLLQAVWRLRGIDKHQTVQFYTLESEAHIIKDALNRLANVTVESGLSLEHVFQYTFLNEQMRKADYNRRMTLQRMKAEVTGDALATVNALSTTATEAMSRYAVARSLFEMELPAQPHNLYGKLQRSAPTSELFEKAKMDLLNSPYTNTFLNKAELTPALDAIIEEMLPCVPIYSPLPDRFNSYEREISIEAETETQLDLDLDLDLDLSRQAPKPYRRDIDWKFTRLDPDQFFSRAYYNENTPGNEDDELAATTLYKLTDILASAKFAESDRTESASPQAFCNAFQEQLLVTSNLHRFSAMGPKSDNDWSGNTCAWSGKCFIPFDDTQPDVTHLLVVQDKKSLELKTVLLSGYDVRELEEIILAARDEGKPKVREVRLALYHIDTGLKLQSEPIAPEYFDSPEFLKLLVQAKFYRGNITYRVKEQPLLREWLAENDSKVLREVFRNHVLRYRTDIRYLFSGSILEAFFTELIDL